ncbi:unknown protein [Seminavis robusta]|uniref:Uncharacterized protein n=1 Tax=Seminavis robusta TaxID=568900 RepID=A0A9N8DLG2_9STRA|nr:unknown protein [Seminavis robusta]|eukprot:Sro121_g058830.1 n/a (110) ;mRNA; f:42671-43000
MDEEDNDGGFIEEEEDLYDVAQFSDEGRREHHGLEEFEDHIAEHSKFMDEHRFHLRKDQLEKAKRRTTDLLERIAKKKPEEEISPAFQDMLELGVLEAMKALEEALQDD